MAPSTVSDPTAIRRLAAETFVLGFPLMMLDIVRRAHALDARRFRRVPISHEPLAPGLTGEDSRFVRASAFANLAQHPARLRLPDTRGRYFTITLIDSSGEAFASLGTRTLTPGPADVVLLGPRWRGDLSPDVADASTLRAPSNLVWIVSRIAAASPTDAPDVEAIAARLQLETLDGEGAQHGPPVLNSLEPPDLSVAHQAATLAPQVFIHRLRRLLDGAPMAVQATIRQPALDRISAISALLQSGATADEVEQAVTRGFRDGLETIRSAARDLGDGSVFGWRARLRAPILAEAGALAWAARTYGCLGAPLAEDLLPLSCRVDESDRALSGQERYRLRFPPNQRPPVRAFWALSIAQADSRDPPYDRIDDRSDLVAADDGGLEIFIQHEPPTGAQAANWLRAPPGEFTLAAELHWPEPAALAGEWRMPPVERLGSRVASAPGEAPWATPPPPGARADRNPAQERRLWSMRPIIPALAAALSFGAFAASPACSAEQAAPGTAAASAKPATAAAAAAADKVEPEAIQALQKMGAYLKTLTTFEVKADTALDVILDQGERIQLDGTTTYKVRRPNGFLIETSTTQPVRQAYYDGKQFTLVSPRLGYYATAPAPATIGETLDVLHERHGVNLPLADLFRWSDPNYQREDLESGFVVGPARVDGVDTTQYAFREGDVDWQIWIAQGDKPLPKKMVIVDRSDEDRPSYTAVMDWNLAPTLAASTFTYTPGADAKQIRIGQVSSQ